MERRGFLRAVGLAAVVPTVIGVPGLRLVPPDAPILAIERVIAGVREDAAWDAARCLWLVRADVMFRQRGELGQITVTMPCADAAEIQSTRSGLAECMRREMTRRRIRSMDLVPWGSPWPQYHPLTLSLTIR